MHGKLQNKLRLKELGIYASKFFLFLLQKLRLKKIDLKLS